MLDLVCLFPHHISFADAVWELVSSRLKEDVHTRAVQEFFSSTNFHDPPRLTALTEDARNQTDNNGAAYLEKHNQNLFYFFGRG